MRLFLYVLVFFGFLNAKILVASSANVTYAMPAIIKAFHKKYSGIEVKYVMASSGKLTAQIVHGAPYDVFMSANMKYPKFLYAHGLAVTKPVVYAKGAIALFSVKHKNLSLNRLTQMSSIAIANPKTAPYGRAAVEAFKKAGIYDKIKNRLVYAETVSAVLPYTVNSCDVGVVAKSLLFSPKLKNIGRFYSADVPQKFYTPINQGIVLLKKNIEAEKFYKFILSKTAKKIFAQYGYSEN